jgi:hypothetical protein
LHWRAGRLLCAALILPAVAALAQGPAAPQVPATPATPAPARSEALLDEVVVSASEPRYVAATRRDRIGRIWAPVYLNDKGPFRLVLDTGANRSAIIASVARALGRDAATAADVRLRGVTGTSVVPAVRIERMDVGDLRLEPVVLPIVLDVFGGAEGVLGNEGLRDKRIVIDFRRDSISIKRSRNEPAGPGFSTLPVTFVQNHLLRVDAMVGNIRTRAIIDTGAPESLGNLALLTALKRSVQAGEQTDIIGVTLDVETGERVLLPTIRLQDLSVRGARMSFGDVYIFQHWHMTDQPSMLVGMDVLGVLEQLVIDYRRRELHVRAGGRG